MERLSVNAMTPRNPSTKAECARPKITPAMPANSTAKIQNAFHECGRVTATMIAVTTPTKTQITARSTHVHPTSSVATTAGAFSSRGSAIMKMTAKTAPMS
jgi:hypothetical protein